MKICQSVIKTIQNVLIFFNIYVSRKIPRNEQQLVLEIHHNILVKSKGILHIGAHVGQEAPNYNILGKRVIWIEALPEIYNKLLLNISNFPNQSAICALLGDQNRDNVPFYLASNNGGSSSIFKFGAAARVWNVSTSKTIKMNMIRLDNLLSKNDLVLIDHWVIDVQGAEYLVLKGAGQLLESCKSIYIEVSTDNYYVDGATWNQISNFLSENNFYSLWSPLENSHTDILFIRTDS